MFKFADYLQNMPGGNFDFKLGSLEFAPSYFTAAAVIVLIFLLIVTLAQVRRHFMNWSIKGALFGLFFGFVLALILEGFLIIGGQTAVTELLGWKSAPKPILAVLDAGHNKLINVLGVSTEIPSSFAKNKVDKSEILSLFNSLSKKDSDELRKIICDPR